MRRLYRIAETAWAWCVVGCLAVRALMECA